MTFGLTALAFGASAATAATIGAGGAALGGALIASKGAKSAANTQAQAEQAANDTNLQMFNTQVGLNAPFRETGLAANNRLSYLLGLGGQGGAPAAPGVSQAPPPQGPPGGFTAQIMHSPTQQAPIPPGPAGTALSQLGLSDRFSVGPDGNSFVSNSTGQALPLSYFTSGQYENDAQTHGGVYGPNGAYQNAVAAPPPPGVPAAPLPPPNNFADQGSLNQQFGASEFAADGAPKFGPFNQAVPTAPQLGQFTDNTNLAQYGGATQLGQFTDNTNLAGFQDMPDFNPDMLKEDPGYAFRQAEGQKGVTNAYAGKGSFLSGAAMKGLDRYNQDYASGEYGNAFNRYQTTRGNKLQDFLTNRDTQQANRSNALSTYMTNIGTQNQNNTNALQTYNTNIGTQQANRANQLQDYTTNLGTQQQNFQNQNTAYNTNLNQYSLNRANGLQDYQTAFDRFQTNRGNVINPLLSMMGYGQQATAGTSSAAQNFGNQSAAAITGAGNATAAGQVGSANAINGALGSASNAFQQNSLMNLLARPGGAGFGSPPNPFYTGQ